MKRLAGFVIVGALAACATALMAETTAPQFMPADHRALTRTISYAEMESFLKSVDGTGPVHLSVEATTARGRSLYLVHLRRGDHPTWKILFYAQQHGDEISGKDALLYLVRDIARDPRQLPEDVDLWIFPMMNPDGAEAGTRVNSAGADLNRDHITLEQPETIALHQVVRRIRPDVAVDCHEFGRDPKSWAKRGWSKWPDVTMDSLNNPLFDPSLTVAAERWLAGVADAEAKSGHRFLRYWVGGVPPDDEQRHSAPDIDSAMNAVGTYGGLSFIVEVAAGPDEAIPRELGNRVDAYLVVFRYLLRDDGGRTGDLATIRQARTRTLPPFLPINYLWVNPKAAVTRFPVIELATGRRTEVATANMMTEVAVKKTAPTPLAYAVDPRAASEIGALLDRPGNPVRAPNRTALRQRRVLHAAAPGKRVRRRLLAIRRTPDRTTRAAGDTRAAARNALGAAHRRDSPTRRAPPRAGGDVRHLPVPAVPAARRGRRSAAGPAHRALKGRRHG